MRQFVVAANCKTVAFKIRVVGIKMDGLMKEIYVYFALDKTDVVDIGYGNEMKDGSNRFAA